MKLRSTASSILFALAILSIPGCSKKMHPGEGPIRPIRKLISLGKSPCFGKCAVYNLTVYDDGLAILEGKDNVDKLGIYHTMLNTLEFDKLKRMTGSVQWKNFRPAYMRNIPDLPVSTLTYYNPSDSSSTSIKSNSSMPPELEEIHKLLSQMPSGKSWIQALKPKEISASGIIMDELQIDMDSTLAPARLEEMFKPYEFKKVSRISEYMNFYLFNFNSEKISPFEMVVLARRTKGVRLVQFNKKTSPRDDF